MPKSFSWIHLSDLHMGMAGQGTLWPRLKHVLYDDLRKMRAKTGPWDIVLFTGDLTQKGSFEEFSLLTKALEELWRVLAELDSAPAFLPIPGNHDLERPHQSDPGTLLLEQWWNTPLVQSGMWDNPDSLYRQTVTRAFSSYSHWKDNLSASIKLPRSVRSGLLPGDISASLDTGFGSVGIIGLNSAWLQLGDGKYDGELLVDPRQLHSVTNGDPIAWRRQHKFNLIMTHHPTSWLNPRAKQEWQAEINPSGAFDVHLFGHMHEQDATSVSHGGGGVIRSVQASSIFGLERYNGALERRHGYSIGRIDDSSGEIRIWPRRAETTRDGSQKLNPDHSLNLDDDESFALLPNRTPGLGHNTYVAAAKPSLALLNSGAQAEQLLEKARYYLPRSLASKNVRSVERTLCKSALTDTHACWVNAEWGKHSLRFPRERPLSA